MDEKYNHGSIVNAVFQPKRTDNLRDLMMPLIGQTFAFEFVGTSCDDEPYPGQSRWQISSDHHPEIPRECYKWMPREDIRIVGQG